jgi:hypothetical protein
VDLTAGGGGGGGGGGGDDDDDGITGSVGSPQSVVSVNDDDDDDDDEEEDEMHHPGELEVDLDADTWAGAPQVVWTGRVRCCQYASQAVCAFPSTPLFPLAPSSPLALLSAQTGTRRCTGPWTRTSIGGRTRRGSSGRAATSQGA